MIQYLLYPSATPATRGRLLNSSNTTPASYASLLVNSAARHNRKFNSLAARPPSPWTVLRQAGPAGAGYRSTLIPSRYTWWTAGQGRRISPVSGNDLSGWMTALHVPLSQRPGYWDKSDVMPGWPSYSIYVLGQPVLTLTLKSHKIPMLSHWYDSAWQQSLAFPHFRSTPSLFGNRGGSRTATARCTLVTGPTLDRILFGYTGLWTAMNWSTRTLYALLIQSMW